MNDLFGGRFLDGFELREAFSAGRTHLIDRVSDHSQGPTHARNNRKYYGMPSESKRKEDTFTGIR